MANATYSSKAGANGAAITKDGRLGAMLGDRGDFALFEPAT